MQKTYQAISRLLAGHMPGYALDLMRPWAEDVVRITANYVYMNRLKYQQDNYNDMVQGFMNQDDELRKEIDSLLIRDAFLLLDDLWLFKRMKESKSYEFLEMIKLQVESPSPRIEDEDDIDGPPRVFRYFWLKQHISEEDLNILDEYILNPAMEEEAQLGLSALTLNLLRQFSQENILFLITICRGKHAMTIMERAWVGLILVMLQYDRRIPFFQPILNAFVELIATPEGNAFALHTLSALVRTSGIPWANESFEKMQTELSRLMTEYKMPGKTEGKMTSLSLDELDDFNKDMSKELQSIVDEQRNTFAKLHEKHLDAHYSQYRHFYTTPFFSEPFRWWLPYDTDYLRNDKEREIAAQLETHWQADLCDSDRFAIISTLSELSTGNGIPEGLLHNVDDLDEPTLVCNSYMQQTYRFFTLNPWNVPNIFEELSNLRESHLMQLLRPGMQDKLHVADLFLACHDYEDALAFYTDIVRLDSSAESWRNMGWCLQKTGEYDEAVKAYDISLEKEVSEWALRQKVWCLMRKDIARYDEALQALDQLLEIRPDDTAYLFEKGKCLEHMELYIEALDIYYKLDALHPGSMQVMRAIAWCAFLTDDNAQAEVYYHKLMESDSRQMIDFLNCGHFLFASGQRAEAFRHYSHALTLSDSLKDFLQIFRPDRRILLEKKVPKSDIYLMEDQLILARPR